MVEPIAIIGLGCRVPGADGPDAFWRMLCEGRDAVGPLPTGRRADFGPGGPPPACGGFLPDVKGFDLAFFGLSRREAEMVDPQQRLLLEVAWEALEFAGVQPKRLRGTRTGVFVGITAHDYSIAVTRKLAETDAYTALGNSGNLAANRISHFLDLRGPSLTVDAACAASLVCVHLACESLRCGDVSLALAGGANLILDPAIGTSFTKARMLSPDGICRSFDAAANGYVRGEGCGIVVLKRVADAERDGDVILAKVLGSAINHNGHSPGITHPDRAAQVSVIRQALEAADVAPGKVGYFEAHGTGTPAGDPIELEALHEVLGRAPARGGKVAVGSVKSNIGHLEAAAGVVALIKSVYCVRTGLLPASLHFEAFSPKVAFVGDRLFIPTTLTNWPDWTPTRIIGINSFGFGGTNCHLLVQAATGTPPPEAHAGDDYLLALSARTPRALAALASRFADHLRETPGDTLADVCHTAHAGRATFDCRQVTRAASREEFCAALTAFAATGQSAGVLSGRRSPEGALKLAFLFGGGSSPTPRLGAALDFPGAASREVLRRLDSLSADGGLGSRFGPFALACAAAATWRSWGIEADLLVGIREEETTAAIVAGLVGPEEVVRKILPEHAPGSEDGLRFAAQHGAQVVLDLRPGHAAEVSCPPLTILRGGLDRATAFQTLTSLFVLGFDVEWDRVEWLGGRRVVGLPTYPFQRSPYWVGARERERQPSRAAPESLGGPRAVPCGEELLSTAVTPSPGVWQFSLTPERIPYVTDHRAAGSVIVPGVVLLEAVLAVGRRRFGHRPVAFENISYLRALLLPEGAEWEIRIGCDVAPDGGYAFGVWSRRPGDVESAWSQNVSGRLAPLPEAAAVAGDE